MKRFWNRLKFGLLILALQLPLFAFAEKPFRRALILPAGGMITAAHLATYHALVNAGIKPDLIIGTCGGGLAAAIIEKFPDQPRQQLEFLSSKKVHEKLLEIRRTKYAGTLHLLKMMVTVPRLGRVQEFDRKYILDVPQNLELFGSSGFSPMSSNKSFATILQSTEFIPRQGTNQDFTQTYLTDRETARYLEGRISSVATLYPNSKVKSETQVISDFTLNEAARASFPDPYVMPPFIKDSRVFMTGAVDGLPLELADQLADSTFYFFKNDIPKLADNIFKSVFGYSFMEKINLQRDSSLSYMTDDDINAGISIDPTFSPMIGMKNNIPANYEAYKEITMLQWNAAIYYVNQILKARGLTK